MSWETLCAAIGPYYPKPGNGRPPIGLGRMLRIHFLQHWFNLTDLACEEALYDSASLCRLLEQHQLGEHVFAVVKRLWCFAKARYRDWSRMPVAPTLDGTGAPVVGQSRWKHPLTCP